MSLSPTHIALAGSCKPKLPPSSGANHALLLRMAQLQSPSESSWGAPPLKERVYSTWYRLRYGWQFRSSVEVSGSPVWVLGRCYHGTNSRDGGEGSEGVPPHILAFMEHYFSLTWMTYRAHFTPIPGTMLTTDCGWGCMVRSGQMMLATVLHYHLLSRDWRLSASQPSEKAVHKQILSWFADVPRLLCPFSLHAMMKQAQARGHSPGDWFGPSQVAMLLRETVNHAKREHPQLEPLLVYVAHDCTVYVGDILDLYGDCPERALFLLVPVRLGGEALNPIYIPCVQSLLTLDHCVGIIGGKPKHSVYFVGFQEDKLLHLDPHYCQPTVNIAGEEFDIKTYHCSTPRKLAANKMDPSCTIGFYCGSREEFHKLRQQAEKVLAPPLQRGVYPFFSFSDQHLGSVLDSSMAMQMGSVTPESSPHETTPHEQHKEESFVVVECRTHSPPEPD